MHLKTSKATFHLFVMPCHISSYFQHHHHQHSAAEQVTTNFLQAQWSAADEATASVFRSFSTSKASLSCCIKNKHPPCGRFTVSLPQREWIHQVDLPNEHFHMKFLHPLWQIEPKCYTEGLRISNGVTQHVNPIAHYFFRVVESHYRISFCKNCKMSLSIKFDHAGEHRKCLDILFSSESICHS